MKFLIKFASLMVVMLYGITVVLSAQSLRTVKGRYTYYAPENVSLENARRIACERAKLQALAEAFGTIVSQTNTTRINNGSKSEIDFMSISDTEVKGEWIETEYEIYEDPIFHDGMISITCQVKGKAREIVKAEIDYKVRILRNGTENKFENDQFRSGDDLFMSFESPVDGFLAAYLVDANSQAFCLLPYRNQTIGFYPIKANKRYVFFSRKDCPTEDVSSIDEYIMTCEKTVENNQIYIIFSPNHFIKAVDTNMNDGVPRQLSFKEFNTWLSRCLKRDRDMCFKRLPIVINR